jgi:hypothetical protein
MPSVGVFAFLGMVRKLTFQSLCALTPNSDGIPYFLGTWQLNYCETLQLSTWSFVGNLFR